MSSAFVMSIQVSVNRSLDIVLSPLLLALQKRRGAGVVLLYHRVSTESDPVYPPLLPQFFDQHCRIIRRHFQTVPLRWFVARLQQGASLAGYCAVTFDDGYRDFIQNAYPVLSRYSLPATHFLVTDSLLSGRPNWTLRMLRLLHYANKHNQLSVLDKTETKSVPEIKQMVMGMGTEERYEWLDRHERRIQELPAEPPMLSAGDLRQCDPELIDWGSHTVSHPELTRCNAQSVRYELEESQRLLGEMTPSPIPYISYPIGAYSLEVMQAARECGYDGGLAVDQAEVTSQSPLYALPRFDVGTKHSSALRLETGGTFNFLRKVRSQIRRVR